MSENPHKKKDYLEIAKHELAHFSAELEKALEGLRDPERRKQLTASCLDALQTGLSKAQEGVAKYQGKVARSAPTAVPQSGSTPDSTPAAETMAARPESEPEAPAS